jgi:hypothetical protein
MYRNIVTFYEEILSNSQVKYSYTVAIRCSQGPWRSSLCSLRSADPSPSSQGTPGQLCANHKHPQTMLTKLLMTYLSFSTEYFSSIQLLVN